MNDKTTSDRPTPSDPAHGRQLQERELSTGKPRKSVDTGYRRTAPRNSDDDGDGSSSGKGQNG